jgi:hypothetical protein
MMYCDDYAILDTKYIVYACMVDPYRDDPDERPEYLIALVLHVGHQGHPSAINYPNRSLRDMAFEQLVAIVKRETADVEDDEE